MNLTKPCYALLAIMFALPATAGEEHDGHEGGHGFEPHHHVAGMLAYAFERDREQREETPAIGVDYTYRYAPRWAVGGFIETLGPRTDRERVVGATLNWFPVAGWSFFAGPGYEFTESDNELLLRLGAGYDFHLADGWSVGSKLIYDAIRTGKKTYIAGIALGKEF